MSGFAGAFVDALRINLLANSGVTSIVGTKVFDQVPGDKRGLANDAICPWVFIGHVVAPRFEDFAHRAWTPRVTIYSITNDFGRDSAWALADAVDAALDEQVLSLNGFTMTSGLRALECGDVIDPLQVRQVYSVFSCVIHRNTSYIPGA